MSFEWGRTRVMALAVAWSAAGCGGGDAQEPTADGTPTFAKPAPAGVSSALAEAGAATRKVAAAVITTPLTDTQALLYIASHGDLIAAFGTNVDAARAHYAARAAIEGREITFDALAYTASHGDLMAAFGTRLDAAARHYIVDGRREGRQTSFDGLAYIAAYGDLTSAFGTDASAGAAHFILYGKAEGRTARFDALRYIASYGDLIDAFGTRTRDATLHYLQDGRREGRQPTFDAARYLANYGDLAAAFGNDLAAATRHYIVDGRREGRTDAPPLPPAYTVAGTVLVDEVAVADSDLNDARQSPVRNNSAARAQAIGTLSSVLGTVNEAGAGPRGNFNDGGAVLSDEDDVFAVDLVAGQVVEVQFTSDASTNDVDLYVESADGSTFGASVSAVRNYECVRVSRTARHFVRVNAYRGASIYRMRLSAPGSTTCAIATADAAFVPGELVAEPRRGDTAAPAKAGAAVDRARLALPAALRPDVGAQLIKLSGDPAVLANGLRALRSQRGLTDKSTLGARATASVAPAGVAEAAEAESLPAATVQMAKRLRDTGAFEYVDLNEVFVTQALTGTYPPNDLKYPFQRWHYELVNLGQAMNRIAQAGIPVNRARPVVAVIDSGVQADHPDLAPQLFSPGRSFLSLASTGDGDTASGDAALSPVDASSDRVNGHGTHVAGTIAAATFDGVGMAGVAPMAQILPLKVFPSAPVNGSRGAQTIDIVQAMRYAVQLSNRSGTVPARKASVINMSLGGGGACSAAYQTAINDARAAGAVVVVAAGNDGADVSSPASCDGAIAVSAVTPSRQLADYSNRGAAVDIAAPGGNTGTATNGSGENDGVWSAGFEFFTTGRRVPTYFGKQGTSMAAPHVAGVLALAAYVNPALTGAQLEAMLLGGAMSDDIGSPGRDGLFGVGLLNAARAVEAAFASLTNTVLPPEPIRVASTAVSLGALQSEFELVLSGGANSSESVVRPVRFSGTAAFTLQAITLRSSPSNAQGTGSYVFTVNRDLITAVGTHFGTLQFSLSSGRLLSVQVAVTKLAPGAVAGGYHGPMLIGIFDGSTGRVLATVNARFSNGRYTWEATGIRASSIDAAVSTDLDNDGQYCTRGEACGLLFPATGTGPRQSLPLTGDRRDIVLSASPLGGISPASAQSIAWPPASRP